MITIAVANQKGGVGKTTIAFNLTNILASVHNKKVLTVDNDPQGNLTSSLLEDPSKLDAHTLKAYTEEQFMPMQVSENLYLLGSDITLAQVAEGDFQAIFKLKENIKSLDVNTERGGFDYVVIDCLPSFGHLHLAALNAADFVLIPVKPSPYALAGMKDLFQIIESAKKHFNPTLSVIGIIINQVDGRKPVIEREMEEALRETYGDLVLKAMINKRVKVEESPALQKAITAYDPNGPAADEFNAMVAEIIGRIQKLRIENDQEI
jgi:chromosome partitioning protein